jgi:Ca-activated chloride channel family protein
MFILDASGSMWGQIDGTTKIEIAKQVMTELIQELPDQADVGLVAYGHRRKGDCEDVEQLVPLQAIDKQLLTERIEAISPKGKTPITRSVEQTAQALRSVEDETIIFLVSDGKESCAGDPCALVKQLRAAGIKFTMHVIGFDVTEEERAQLECMAQAGGGTYFTAKTAQELEIAAKKAVMEEPAEPSRGHLSVEVLVNGEPDSAGLYVFRAGTRDRVTTDDTSHDNPKVLDLDPGVYDLEVWYRKSRPESQLSFAAIEIVAGETVEKRADFGFGQLSIEALVNGEKGSAGLYVFQAGTNTRVTTGDTSRDNPKVFRINAGAYDVKVAYRKAIPETELVLEGVQVIKDQTVAKQVVFEEGQLEVRATSGGQTVKADLKFFHPGETKRFGTGYADKTIKMRPGDYEDLVRAYKLPDKPEKRLPISIRAGETVTLDVEL